jgi:ribosomal protein L19
MKKIFIYSFLLVLISFNQTPVKAQNNDESKPQIKSTSTVSSYNIGSELRMTYAITQNTDDGICNFKGYCSMKVDPAVEINMVFHFEKSGIQVEDTLNTQLFSKFMDLNNVKRIQIDSLTYKMIDKEIKLKFIVSLIRDETAKLKIVDKYSMVYSSGFKNSRLIIVADKIEKSSVEILGNTY